MRIAIVGAGAVGCYYGGLLAKGGNDVHFIARGRNLLALKQNGLKIKGSDKDVTVKVEATDDPSGVGPVDLIVLAVKSYDTDRALEAIGPMVGEDTEDTAILSLQNGVDNEERIAKRFGVEKTLGGSAYVNVVREAPGIIRHTAQGRIAIGEFSGGMTKRVERMAGIFEKSGIPTKVYEKIMVTKWRKLVWNTGFNALTAITRSSVREVLEIEEAKEIARNAMKELIEVAAKEGIIIEESIIEKALSVPESAGGIKTSMLQDLERGKPLEIDAMNGVIVRKGKEHGVLTPVNETLYLLAKAISRREHTGEIYRRNKK